MDALSWLDFQAIEPELFLAVAGLVLVLVGAIVGEGSRRFMAGAVIAAFAVTALLLVDADRGTGAVVLNGLFRADGFGGFMKLLVLLGAGLSVVVSLDFLERAALARFEYPLLCLFATLGMMLMVSANDLMSLYVGLELQSLALYVLAAFSRDSERSTEAGLKYFVLGALSSGMLLYGASMVYGFSGATNFDAIASTLGAGAPPVGVVIGLVFVLAGLAFKVAAVPFHMWTPDVYEGAPTPVTAFFAVAPKVAAIALFVRTMIGPFGDLVAQWQQIVVFISVASMALGAFAAIAQANIKRLMAYSSIGHMGYVLVGLAAGSEKGVAGIALYMAIYLAMNVGTFAIITGMRVGGKPVEGIADLAGLSRTRPLTAAALAVLMFSMAGVPPTAGFFGKLYVFMAAIDAHLYTLAILGVLASVVGCYYYIRIIKVMYFDEATVTLDPLSGELGVVTALSTAFILLFWIVPSSVVTGASAAAAALFAG